MLDGTRDMGPNNSHEDTLSFGDQGSIDEEINEKPILSKTLDSVNIWSQYK